MFTPTRLDDDKYTRGFPDTTNDVEPEDAIETLLVEAIFPLVVKIVAI